MSPHTFPSRLFRWIVLALGAVSIAMVVFAFTGYRGNLSSLSGRLLPDATQGVIPWKIVSPESLINGTIIPGNTNVILAIPDEQRLLPNPITKKVLFGTNAADVKYWGYCLPDDYDREKALKTTELPGKIFLSDGERKARDAEFMNKLRGSFTPTIDRMTEEYLNELKEPLRGSMIRNQMETFRPDQVCYVMSEKDLPVAIDTDDDEANNQIEKVYQTNYLNPDTDEDGIPDGCEIFRLHTDPLLRDSDGDGLIDGMEDANHNCRYEVGVETNPFAWDTDHDGLPDGLMRMRGGRNSQLMGEDKNLNGLMDEGETSPIKWSTAGDDVSDGDLYWKCIFNNEEPNLSDC